MAHYSRDLLVCLIFVVVNYVIAQDITDITGSQNYQYGRAIKCKRDDGVSQRCMPVFENIAFDKDIYANNTCGLNGQSVTYTAYPLRLSAVNFSHSPKPYIFIKTSTWSI